MKIIGKAILVCLFWAASPLQAATVIIDAVPATWRMENYPGNNVVAWFTGSSCTNGQLTFGTNWTTDDKDRFWALVMAAKVSGKTIGVAYDNATTGCPIISFYFKEQ